VCKSSTPKHCGRDRVGHEDIEAAELVYAMHLLEQTIDVRRWRWLIVDYILLKGIPGAWRMSNRGRL